MAQITIIGYEKQCDCDHCGRALQHGIRVTGHGVIGADCFRAMIKSDRKKFSQGKPDATFVRTLAKLAERDSPDMLRRLGYHASLFVYEVAA